MRGMRRPLAVMVLAASASAASCSSTTNLPPPAPAPAVVPTPDPSPPAATPPAPTPARTSVYLDDIDRTADPCTDFYQYANGTWRANNPIPASMDRWSRRWQAGETNKTRLTEILDAVSARTDWPAHSIEQQIGDLYASCTDEAAADAAGTAPIQPLLAEIAALQTAADV